MKNWFRRKKKLSYDGKDWEKRFATLISARHMMIKRSFLLENQICFSEDEIWHTDVGFMMEVLSGAYEKKLYGATGFYMCPDTAMTRYIFRL